MADRRISDLNPAPSTIDDSNTLFVVEQARTAYRVDGHAFITALTTILDGHGGIADIEYTEPPSGSLDGTLTITLADQSTTELTITNGNGISSITQYFAVNNSSSSVPSSWNTTRQTMTSSNRYLWSYFHFVFNNNTSVDTPKSVVGVYGDTGNSWYIWIRYAGQQPTSDSDIGTTPDNWIGIYSGTASTAPTSYTSYTWYEYKGEKGDTGEAATISSQNITYLESSSGTVVPTGSWTTTVPTVTPGNFLWTRTELFFNEGTTVTSYSVARYGIDGSGSVSTVNSISPDSNGNIALTASGIPTSDSTSVQSHITNIESAINGVTAATATPLVDGTAAVGTSTKYARQDHVHPTDTSRQATLVSGTSIKTVNGASVLGSGNISTLPKKANLTFSSGGWTGSDPYTQTISITGLTPTANTKVDIQPDATALSQLMADGVSAIYIVNNNGTLTLYAIGAATTANITVQVTYYETA